MSSKITRPSGSQRAGHDVGQQARAVASAERGVAEQAGVAADPGGALADSRLPERRRSRHRIFEQYQGGAEFFFGVSASG